MKVLAIANEFGFGPVAILTSVISSMPDRFDVDIYVPHSLLNIASQATDFFKSTSASLIPIDNFNSIDCTQYDAAIISSDYIFVQKIEKALDRIIIIDALFWFWDTPWAINTTKTLIIAQDFYGVKERAKGLKEIKVVKPILPPYLERNSKPILNDTVLVNLGGFLSPLHKPEYAESYIQMINPILETLCKNTNQIIITGGECIVKAVKKVCTVKNIKAFTLNHTDMIENLKKCKFYVTVPGLGAIYESFTLDLVPLFLPATNLTQFLQAKALKRNLNYRWIINCYENYNNTTLLSSKEKTFINELFEYYSNNIDNNKTYLNEQTIKFINKKEYITPCDKRYLDEFLNFVHDNNCDAIDEIIKHLGV